MKTLTLIIFLVFVTNAWTSDCDSIPNSEHLFRPGVVLMLGEIHGTNQAPQAISNFVCNALKQKLSVIVGLEIPDAEQRRLDKFMRSDGTIEDMKDLIAGHFWQKDYQDGRSSQAMHKLIEILRAYNAVDSNSVRVVFIDNPEAEGGRDKFMAESLSSAISVSPESFVITLTGNVHNRVILGSHFDDRFEAMGYRFTNLNPEIEVYSLDMDFSEGTAWVCGASKCGAVSLMGNGEGNSEGVAVYQRSEFDAFDGVYYVGPISASAPAKDK